MSKKEKISVAWIGEWSENTVPWWRQLRGVDGTEYRLYHRRGHMYCFNVETGDVLLERDEGGAHDMAGSDAQVLEQISDVFERLGEGETCVVCGAIYPHQQIPLTCFQCGYSMRMLYVVSLQSLEPSEYENLRPIRPALDKESKVPDKAVEQALQQVEQGRINGGWALEDELENTLTVLVTDECVIGLRINADAPAELIATYALKGEEVGTFKDYMLSLLALEAGVSLDLDLLECRECWTLNQRPDPNCAACGKALPSEGVEGDKGGK